MQMKIIGVLFGEEQTFPPALVEYVNGLDLPNVRAEYVKVGVVEMAEASHYDVVLDRISHDIPFYRSVLQNMMLGGTRVVNNPFWTIDDDKFFSHALAKRMGVPTPKTVIFPTKRHPPGTSATSMRNLTYPVDWDAAFGYVGFPAYVKPDVGMGWQDVHRVEDAREFFEVYDQTGSTAMLLQEAIEFSEYYRCYVVGARDVHVMPYEPRNPHERRYAASFAPSPELDRRMRRHSLDLMSSMGYDCNSIEFAVRDGVPYAIDYLNGAPDAELASVGELNFRWVVKALGDFLVDQARAGRIEPREYSWSRFMQLHTAADE